MKTTIHPPAPLTESSITDMTPARAGLRGSLVARYYHLMVLWSEARVEMHRSRAKTRPRWVRYAVAAIIISVTADIVQTLIVMHLTALQGLPAGSAEVNPVNQFVGHNNVIVMTGFRIGTAVLAILGLLWVSRFHISKKMIAIMVVVLSAYAGFVGYDASGIPSDAAGTNRLTTAVAIGEYETRFDAQMNRTGTCAYKVIRSAEADYPPMSPAFIAAIDLPALYREGVCR